MTNQFIEGIPEGLEKHLATYTPNQRTNITLEELRSYVRGYIPKPAWSFTDGDEKKVVPASEDVYFFFPFREGSVELKIGDQIEMFAALQREKYGFSPEQRVRINPSRLELTLSEQARQKYESILNSGEIVVNDLLEAVGFIVNHSMEYDFEKIRRMDKQQGDDPSRWDEVQRNYKPTGEEVIKGICTDAGLMIRGILGSLGIEDRLKYTYVSSSNNLSYHDTTCVFDKTSGEWAVISSKSPTKPYNLTPKNRLAELGFPYVG